MDVAHSVLCALKLGRTWYMTDGILLYDALLYSVHGCLTPEGNSTRVPDMGVGPDFGLLVLACCRILRLGKSLFRLAAWTDDYV